MSEEENRAYLRRLRQVQEEWNSLHSGPKKTARQRARDIIDAVSPRHRK